MHCRPRKTTEGISPFGTHCLFVHLMLTTMWPNRRCLDSRGKKNVTLLLFDNDYFDKLLKVICSFQLFSAWDIGWMAAFALSAVLFATQVIFNSRVTCLKI